MSSSLTNDQVSIAVNHLACRSYLNKFPQIQQLNVDDKLPRNQVIGLFTFTPSQDAKPDKNGLYGIIRLRGNFPTAEKADDHSKYLISHVSSYDEILYAPVGRDVPLAVDFEKYCLDQKEIDIQKGMDKITVDNLRKKIELENQESKEILEKKKKMDEMNKITEKMGGVAKLEITLDRYTELRVKFANQKLRKAELLQKLAECASSLGRGRKEILEANLETKCEFVDKFMDNYVDALKKIGSDLSKNPSYLQLKRDLVEDPELDGKIVAVAL